MIPMMEMKMTRMMEMKMVPILMVVVLNTLISIKTMISDKQ